MTEIEKIPFDVKENELIEAAMSRFKAENSIVKFEENKINVRLAINAYHDRYGMINTPPAHKIMRNILRKCGVKIEEPDQRTAREAKELKLKQKEIKRKLREQVKERYKKEQEREIAEMGLEDEPLVPKEPKPPRKDITTVETFSNIPETLEENAKKKEAEKNKELKVLSETEDMFPGFNYVALGKNTVVQLKLMADYLEIGYDGSILKKDLIIEIQKKIE